MHRRGPPAGGLVALAVAVATADPTSVTTSPSIPASAALAAPAAGTGCCSTSRTSSTRSASIGRATPTSRSGTRRRSATTARRSCSPDEWGGGTPAALPRHRQVRVGRRRDLHDRERPDGVQELLQDSGRADVVRELRRAQRLAHPDPRARSDGAGLVSRRHLGLRLDRPVAAAGDRVLRSRSARRDADDYRRLVVGLLVQRADRELGDRSAGSTSSSSCRAVSSRRTRSMPRRLCASTT